MSLDERSKKIIISRAGGICCFPGCKVEFAPRCSEKKQTFVAEFAHIYGEKPGSARFDVSVLLENRNSADNIIALCPTHHKIIDDQPSIYPVEELQKLKKNHEDWVHNQTIGHLSNLTFSELSVIARHISNHCTEPNDLTTIHPKEKIKKNELSQNVENLIIRGLSQESLVKDYIEAQPDSDFGERLKQGFIERYILFKEQGFKGDSLFYAMFDHVCEKIGDFSLRAATLTVLSYYFETCDIFEK